MLKKSLLLGLAAGFAVVTGAIAADPIKIAFIAKNTGNPYFDSVTAGFEDACAALGCEFDFVAPATAEATSQISIIEAQIQRGVDVIAVAPNSPDAMNQVFDEARSKGVLVLAVDGELVGSENHRDAAILPIDFAGTGADQVELLGSMINYEGEIAILSSTTEAPAQNAFIGSMVNALSNNPKYKDMELVATVYGDDQPEKSTTEMEALLANYPNLAGVMVPTSVGLAAAAQVVQSRGIAEQVKVTGLGLPSEMRDFVKDGTIEAFQLWTPYNEGWLAVYLADEIINGNIANEAGHMFDVPKLGTISILENSLMYTQATLTRFDAANIDEFRF